MVDIEVVPKAAPIDHPHQILIKLLPRNALSIRHTRMLYFNINPRVSPDVGAMNFAILGGV